MTTFESIKDQLAGRKKHDPIEPMFTGQYVQDVEFLIAEIERLKKVARDDHGVLATECQILWELTEDDEIARSLLDEYPLIAFYTRDATEGNAPWRLVHGKEIEVLGMKFGAYYASDTNSWFVVEFESGASVCDVVEFRETLVIPEMMIEMIGIDAFKTKVAETIAANPTLPPDIPRKIGSFAQAESEDKP